MEPIPSGWPPEPAGSASVVPLFPHPRLWLFPKVILQLHIFEPRYVQMVEDCLDGPGRLAIGTVPSEHSDDLAGTPPVEPIAGLGEIGRHERLPDGRYLLWIYGQARARVREVASDRLYRRVEVEPIDDSAPPGPGTDALREELAEAIRVRAEEPSETPDSEPLGALADYLTLRLDLPPEVLQDIYSETDPLQRARAALREHRQRPLKD